MQRMQRGFALIELLITMIIVTAMIPITIICLSPFQNLLQFDERIQDQIALRQIRRIIMLSYDPEFSSEELDFIYQEKQQKLRFINHHLVLSPGTQIFLSDIDDAGFEEKDGFIYVVYERDHQIYECILCQEE